MYEIYKMHNVGIVIQARTSSTRLPNKVMMEIIDHKSMLQIILERVNQCQTVNKIIVATTVNQCDNPIIKLCMKKGIDYFRGSEHDVLERYYETAKKYNLDIIIRITSDCPGVDPQLINRMLASFNYQQVDYLSNTMIRTYPRGFDVEIFSFQALEKAYLEAIAESDREHVTPYIYGHGQLFQLWIYRYEEDYSQYRFTVDTEEDLRIVRNVFKRLPIDFKWNDVINELENYQSYDKDVKFNSSNHYHPI